MNAVYRPTFAKATVGCLICGSPANAGSLWIKQKNAGPFGTAFNDGKNRVRALAHTKPGVYTRRFWQVQEDFLRSVLFFQKNRQENATQKPQFATMNMMLNGPESNPFALTEEVWHAPLFHHTIGYWVINVGVLAAVIGGGIWAVRKAFGAVTGRNSVSRNSEITRNRTQKVLAGSSAAMAA